MTRVNLTDRRIAALQGDPAGKLRPELRDAVVPSLIVRAAAKRKAYFLHTRFPGSKWATRVSLGQVGTIPLEDARTKAQDWLAKIARGIDPRKEAEAAERATRDAAQAATANLFANVAEDYLRAKADKRQIRSISRIVRGELVRAWGNRAITDITRKDVKQLINAIKARAPVQAAMVFAFARAVFGWAISEETYDFPEHWASPCDRMKFNFSKVTRERVLDNSELCAFWAATDRMPYPWGPMFQLLLLTGARRNEISGARWKEFDLHNHIWTIPAERYKTGQEHRLPLTDGMVEILNKLTRFDTGDHLFSFTFGATPIRSFDKAKRRLDALVLDELRKLRGDDAQLKPFRVHDLRRTMRTKLAALGVEFIVAELALGHAKRGIHKLYDQHRYERELRRALDAWGSELKRIVSGTAPDDNVVPITRAGA